MTDVTEPDLCVIGAGSGGLSVASAATALGAKVVLIEQGRMGGECLNTGCVPSKALLASARRAHDMRTAAAFGIGATEPAVDFAAVQARIRQVIGTIAPIDSEARYTAMNVDVIGATARFVSRDTVEAGGRRIKARRFVVATGSRPAMPPIPGLESVGALTSDTIFDLAILPEHLVVLGGGAVGLEMAQAFRRLGAAVTLVEPAAILAAEDPEFTRPLVDALVREGVDLRVGVSVTRVEPATKGLRADLSAGEPLHASHVLVAAGRVANVENLGLEAAGVAFDRTGIKVQADMRTGNRRIYAVGDVAASGIPRLTHAANYEAGIALRAALFRLPARAKAASVPRVVYTEPELAVCGPGEEEIRRTHRDVQVLRTSFADNDRAVAEGETVGHIKVITTRKGRVLGVGIVGAQAGELIAPWQIAVAKGLPVTDLAGIVLPYPTRAETIKRIAVAALTPRLRSPWLARAMTVLRWLG